MGPEVDPSPEGGAREASDRSPEQDVEQFEKLAEWLDTKFALPGTSMRLGLDGLLGLLPGIGDTVTATMGLYAFLLARRHGAPASAQLAILANLLIDWLGGFIPLIGDLFDFAFKAHARNAQVLRKHIG